MKTVKQGRKQNQATFHDFLSVQIHIYLKAGVFMCKIQVHR